MIGGDISTDELRPVRANLRTNTTWRRTATDLLEPKQRAKRLVARADDRVRQPAWTRSWPAPSYRYGATAHAYALQVLDEIMGNGATSRLYRKLVVEQQLAVSASASYEPSKRGPPTSSSRPAHVPE